MVLTWLDYVVIASYLLAITAFGSWFARFQKTTRDYFLTGRSVPWWAICFTIVATETSTLTFIGIPAQSYAGNMTFLQLSFGYIIGRCLVAWFLLPQYMRGDLFSGYQVPPFYDSLLAKIAVWGKDRNESIERMERALRETIIDGVSHVTPLHRLILADEKFRAGEIHTGFVGAFLDRSRQLVAGAQKESVE